VREFRPGLIGASRSEENLIKAIDRLIELDEQETAKQRERVEFLSLMNAVIEALPDGLVVTDVDGDIVLFNERAELMFGYHRSEMIGKKVEKLMPERARARHTHDREMYTRFSVNLRARTMGVGLALVGVHRDGHEFQTEITLARMVVPKGVFVLASIRFSPRETVLADDEPSRPEPGIVDPHDGQ
jgi:PAS domain S-box-containing protein